MATNYPGGTDNFTNPVGTNFLDSPDHASQHANINDAMEAVQSTVGTTLGTNVLMHHAAGQFPVRATGGAATGTLQQTLVGGTYQNTVIGTSQTTGGTSTTQAIHNPTIGTPAISNGTMNNGVFGTPTFTIGSDVTGDLFYRSSGGGVARLAAGALNFVLTSGGVGTAPTWAASSGGGGSFFSSSFDRDLTAASGTQGVTGVGFTPRMIMFMCVKDNTHQAFWGYTTGTTNTNNVGMSTYMASGSADLKYTFWTTSCVAFTDATNEQKGLLSSFTADGFIINWTKTNSPTGTGKVLFLAFS